jgi:hypothetical protein
MFLNEKEKARERKNNARAYSTIPHATHEMTHENPHDKREEKKRKKQIIIQEVAEIYERRNQQIRSVTTFTNSKRDSEILLHLHHKVLFLLQHTTHIYSNSNEQIITKSISCHYSLCQNDSQNEKQKAKEANTYVPIPTGSL